MNAATPSPSTDPRALPRSQRVLIFAVMAFGMFMALLDIQIVAASLNEIQAGLAAGPEEISWVQTAYLMAELVMIPFSAFLARAMSTRWLFATSAALFAASSAACGLAWSIDSMTAFRAIQGFTGGAMIPTVFAVGFVLFDGKERALVPAILGMVSVLAPTLGPTVGGLVTEYMGWRWIFFVNVVPGAAVTAAILAMLRIDNANTIMFRRIDWLHLSAMALALGCLEYVLEEGPRLEWFGDDRIAISAWLSLVGFIVFIERSLCSETPIVKLSPFRRPSFALACAFNLVIGFGLFSSTYLIPVYLGRVRGFNSLQIGATVCVIGIAQLLSTVLAARLSERVDVRYILAVGLLLFAFSLWLVSHVNANWGFAEFVVPQLVRGLAIMFCIVPSVNTALSGFTGMELRYASGLFNLMRNLGGAIGVALVNTWLQDNARVSAARFGGSLGHASPAFESAISGLTGKLIAVTGDPWAAQMQAQMILNQEVRLQSLVVAFDEVFRSMSWMFVITLIMVPFAKRMTDGPTSSAGDEH